MGTKMEKNQMLTGKPIFYVGGSKGGVGKSIVAGALMDYLVGSGQPVLLVEADTANPDVGWAYETAPGVTYRPINLDHQTGWSDLIDDVEQHKDKVVVINTPARNNMGVAISGVTLTDSLAELERSLEVLWVINRQRDSLELLEEFMRNMPGGHIHVVRNLFHGREEEFTLYNDSKLRTLIEEAGGKSLNFATLGSRVADSLNTKRIPISVAAKELSLGNRAELQRWRRVVGTTFAEVVVA